MDYKSLAARYTKEACVYFESKKARRTLIICLIVGACLGAYYGNKSLQNRRQQNAIAAFNEAMQTYITALAFGFNQANKNEKAPWEEVELAFQMAYQQNNKAQFAPFFLIYSAQAFAGQFKYIEAAKMVGEALAKMDPNSAFYDLYSIMQANFLIDGNDLSGVDQLNRLATESKAYQEMAQYYLAQYYLAQNQIDASSALFKKLAEQTSAWGDLAKHYV